MLSPVKYIYQEAIVLINERSTMMKTKTTITKRMEFCYGHFLPGYNGKCKNIHGHNAVLEVTVSRTHDLPSYPGMIMDFKELKTVTSGVLEILDHKLLNDVLTATPTAENIAQFIFDYINSRLYIYSGIQLEKVKVSETPDSWAEVKRCE